jgi:hypothetical protein
MMARRRVLSLLGVGLLQPIRTAWARLAAPGEILLTAPLELGGSWGGSTTADATAVIERMRLASFAGVDLLSDRQPRKLRVDDRAVSNPAVWLHTEEPKTAWIIVIVGARDWCKLAYQFGHELGHVFCNSWQPDATPKNPCQWIEEALVEAFSLRGLGRLADEWEQSPPFPDDNGFANSIREYRELLVAGYRSAAQDQGISVGFGSWFKKHETFFKTNGGIDAASGAVSTMSELLQSDPGIIADMGALNRWPGRSGVPLRDYLDLWERSCRELGTPGRLPGRVRSLIAGV